MRVLSSASSTTRPKSSVAAARAAAPVKKDKAARLPQGAGLGLLWAASAATSLALTAGLHAADLSAGQQVFSNSCVTCHSGGMNAIEPDKTLEKDALKEYLDGGFSVDAIVTQVTNGKGSMPAWGKSLSPDQIKNVAAYVFNQADTDAW